MSDGASAARALVAHIGSMWRQALQAHSGVNLDRVEAHGFLRGWRDNSPEMGNIGNGNQPGRVWIDELAAVLGSAHALGLVLDEGLVRAAESQGNP